MPRNVRNFWISGNVDGRESLLTGGPIRKDGGFDLRIYMRNDGDIDMPVRIYGEARGNKLDLHVDIIGKGEPIVISTVR